MFLYQNKGAKYHNKKVMIDGHNFDSKLEAQRYTKYTQHTKYTKYTKYTDYFNIR